MTTETWQPLEPCKKTLRHMNKVGLRKLAERQLLQESRDPIPPKLLKKLAKARIAKILLEDKHSKMYANGDYDCLVKQNDSAIYLSLKNRERTPITDYEVIQRITQQFCPEDHTPVELLPAAHRLVDAANQYHVFCLKPEMLGKELAEIQGIIEDEEDKHTGDTKSFPNELTTLVRYKRPSGPYSWRQLFAFKNETFGQNVEAINLVQLATPTHFFLLGFNEEGYTFPFGFSWSPTRR